MVEETITVSDDQPKIRAPMVYKMTPDGLVMDIAKGHSVLFQEKNRVDDGKKVGIKPDPTQKSANFRSSARLCNLNVEAQVIAVLLLYKSTIIMWGGVFIAAFCEDYVTGGLTAIYGAFELGLASTLMTGMDPKKSNRHMSQWIVFATVTMGASLLYDALILLFEDGKERDGKDGLEGHPGTYLCLTVLFFMVILKGYAVLVIALELGQLRTRKTVQAPVNTGDVATVVRATPTFYDSNRLPLVYKGKLGPTEPTNELNKNKAKHNRKLPFGAV